MRKSWGLTEKILSGEKKIESRWYQHKARPWDHISANDTIYFKDSGEPIKIRALVKKVLQFENLNPNKVKEILEKYAEDDGIERDKINAYFEMFKNKKHCLLIFLKDAESIKPFRINKSGFGSMAAWLIVDSIDKIKLR